MRLSISTSATSRNVFRYCRACGLYVPKHQSAVLLDTLFYQQGGVGRCPEYGQELNCRHLAVEDCHLLPVVHDGKVVCRGCPELAQYFPGQRRSWKFPYNESEEELWRRAYDLLKTR